MASYHFTIKLDRRPDASQVAATDHIDYINREGEYKEIDEKRQGERVKFSGNYIAAAEETQQNILNNITPTTLYDSKYGIIIESENGIETSDKSSVDTLHITIALAQKKYGSKLKVTGSNEYKAKMIVAAVEMQLPIQFADLEMETQRIKLQEAEENERRIARESSGKSVSGTDEIYKSSIKPDDIKPIGTEPPPQRRNHLHSVHQLDMVQDPEDTDLLLQSDVSQNMGEQKTGNNHGLRREISRGRRINAEKIADNILNGNTNQVSAGFHADYINRDEKFAVKGGCVYKAHHLPKWADDSPKKFFKMGDTYEVTSTVYREIEFALPNELNLEQQLEVVNQFVESHLGNDFYWSLAIHEKEAAMGNGERNPHVHIMFSERKLDEIEKQNERQPEVFFKKGNPRDRVKGGPNKDQKWIGKDRSKYVVEMRKDCALIQNAVLEKYGFDVTVDYRSLVAQREAALERGDLLLAELLDRNPEENVVTQHAYNSNDPKVASLKQYRQVRKEHQQLIIAADVLRKSIHKDETNESVDGTIEQANFALSDIETNNLSDIEELKTLSHSIIDISKELDVAKHLVIWDAKALAKARHEFLTENEQALEKQAKLIKEDIFTLKRAERQLRKPESWNREALDQYSKTKNQITTQLDSLNTEAKNIAAQLKKANEKFFTKDYKTKLAKAQKEIMNSEENRTAHQMLAELQRKLDDTVAQTREIINKHLDDKFNSVNTHIQKLLTPYLIEKEKLAKELSLVAEQKAAFIQKEKPPFYHEKEHAVWQKEKADIEQCEIQIEKHQTELDAQIESIKKTIYEAPPIDKSKPADIKPTGEELIAKTIAPYLERKKSIDQERIALRKDKAEIDKLQPPKFYATDAEKADYTNRKDLLAKREEKLNTLENTINAEMEATEKSLLEAKQTPAPKPKNDIEYIQITANEAQGIIAAQIRNLKSDLEYTEKEIEKIKHNIFSEARAHEMAKSRFAKSEFQAICKERQEIEKESSRIKKAMEECTLLQQKFATMEKPKWFFYKSEYANLEIKINEMDNSIAERQTALQLRIQANEKQLADLESKCNTPSAKATINKITAGILADHKLTNDNYSNLTAKRHTITKQIADLTSKKSILDKQVKHETNLIQKTKGYKPTYKVGVSIGSGGDAPLAPSNNKDNLLAAAQRLAEGILNPKIAALVARIQDNVEYDFAVMTPEQIETALAQIAKERVM